MDRSWAFKALGAWIGTLIGIGLTFYVSRIDFGARHGFAESMGVAAGWGMAIGSPMALLIGVKTRWDTPR